MKIYHPAKNLGCLGFTITKNLYFAFYCQGFRGDLKRGIAMFLRYKEKRFTISLYPKFSFNPWY